jgi:hypothetical protein
VFENGVLRGIFRPKREEETGGWTNCVMRSSVSYTLYQISHYYIRDQIKCMCLAGHVASIERIN